MRRESRVWWPPLVALALLKLTLHLATAGAYGFHRDELYYLACGRHLALGYVDHPPLVPWLAALSEALFGLSLSGLRLWPALAGSALVMLTGMLAAGLGGGRYAQALAAMGALSCPLLLAANGLFQTVTFDLLTWTLTLLVLVRLLAGDSGPRWIAFGAVAGLGLITKYTYAALLLALLVGLTLAGEWRHFRRRWLWLGGLVGVLLVLPNLLWQFRHGWPSLEFVATSSAGSRTEPAEFLVSQLLQVGPFSFPLWVGAFLFLFSRRGRPFLALGWAALFVLCFFLVLGAKAYYPGPIYVLLFAAGGVYLEPRFAVRGRALLRLVGAFPFLLLLGNLAPLPYFVPWYPPEIYAERQERIDNDDFAERFGWRELVDSVADAWTGLPPEVRERTTILTSSYGSAAAIDLLGERYGLPPAASGHNTYWFWSRGAPLDPVIAIGFERESLEGLWTEVVELGVLTNVYGVKNEEYGRSFYLCRGLVGRSDELWPRLRHYD